MCLVDYVPLFIHFICTVYYFCLLHCSLYAYIHYIYTVQRHYVLPHTRHIPLLLTFAWTTPVYLRYLHFNIIYIYHPFNTPPPLFSFPIQISTFLGMERH